jgi:aspartokinase-like uncharacterized kinase
MPLVVKVGGSLCDWPELGKELPRWLSENAPPETLIVAGGGPMVERVRDLYESHRIDDEGAHWLALAAMNVTADLLIKLLADKRLVRVASAQDCVASWARGEWPTLDAILFAQHDDCNPSALPHSWDATSDSVAARLAELLAADLVLLKSADPPPGDFAAWSAAGYVDAHCPLIVSRAKLTVRAVNLRNY